MTLLAGPVILARPCDADAVRFAVVVVVPAALAPRLSFGGGDDVLFERVDAFVRGAHRLLRFDVEAVRLPVRDLIGELVAGTHRARVVVTIPAGDDAIAARWLDDAWQPADALPATTEELVAALVRPA